MKESWQTALSLGTSPGNANKWVQERSYWGTEGKEGKKNAREATDVIASILTPSKEQNGLFESKVAAWRAAYGITALATQRRIKDSIGRNAEREGERGRERGGGCIKSIAQKAFSAPSCSFLLLFLWRLRRAQGEWIGPCLWKRYDSFFLECAYVTPFDKSDNLAFSREIEILDWIVSLTNTCTNSCMFYFFCMI